MNKTYIFSGDTLKTMFQGALELNNEKQDLFIMDKHQKEIDELKEP
jgi:hypothetical protein